MATLEEVLIRHPHVDTVEDAALFLSEICATDIVGLEYLGVAFPAPEAFACALHRHERLHRDVIQCHRNQEFSTFWTHFRRQVDLPPSFSNDDPEAVTTVLADLDALKDKFRDLAAGNITFPYNPSLTWTQDVAASSHATFMESLRLPWLRDRAFPHMELVNLGNMEGAEMQARIDDIFRRGTDTFLVNASGSGKTRVALEALCRHWGLYITADDTGGAVGSSSLADALQSKMDRFDKTISRVLPPPSSFGSSIMLAHNLSVLRRHINCVLLAHLVVFHFFLQNAADAGTIAREDSKKFWTLFQASSPMLKRPDLVWTVYVGLLSAPPTQVSELIPKYSHKVQELCGEPFFLVLDQANVPARILEQGFRDGQGNYRSVLPEVIQSWKSVLGESITFVVMGYDIPRAYFCGEEWSSIRWSTNAKFFADQDAQLQYVQDLIPPTYLASDAGKALQIRMWQWLRHRPKYTAWYLMNLIVTHYKYPHRILRQLVKESTGYEMRMDQVDQEESLPTGAQTLFRIHPLLVTERTFLPAQEDSLIRATIHEIIFTYLTTGHHPPCYSDDRIGMVGHTLARFVSEDMKQVAMDDTLMLCTATIWLTSPVKSPPLCGLFNSCDEVANLLRAVSERPFRPGPFLAWLFAFGYSQKRWPINNVFKVYGGAKHDWTQQGSEIVTLHRTEAGAVRDRALSSSDLANTSPPIAFRAASQKDVVSWLKHEQNAPFCICPDGCSADLIFALKLNVKKKQHLHRFTWVVLRASTSNSDGPKPVPVAEVQKLRVENLFSNTAEERLPVDDLIHAFSSLPKGQGKFPVLHVLATFPELSVASSELDKIDKNRSTGFLQLKFFKDTAALMKPEDIVEGVVASVIGERPERATSKRPLESALDEETDDVLERSPKQPRSELLESPGTSRPTTSRGGRGGGKRRGRGSGRK